MIKSMTAFANSETQFGSLTINCELRSVNHRYCDISFKLPEQLRFLEGDLRSIINAKIKRGKVECCFNYKKHSQNDQLFTINHHAVKALIHATSEIETLMQHPIGFSALDVLAFNGIQQETPLDQDNLKSSILALLVNTVENIINARIREGEKLQIFLETHCQKMNDYVTMATQRMPQVISLIRHKLQTRINEFVNTPNLERFEQEIVFMMQKLDVTEELERLETHISETQRILNQQGPVGRRLDFLMQEMNREANTLGSKSADQEMTQISIELKVLIEQMREQIQNIE
ncbi:MAG: YicC family protein [Methylococcales bacterium]|nr:YicC family protein [Methylococcales bacterium]